MTRAQADNLSSSALALFARSRIAPVLLASSVQCRDIDPRSACAQDQAERRPAATKHAQVMRGTGTGSSRRPTASHRSASLPSRDADCVLAVHPTLGLTIPLPLLGRADEVIDQHGGTTERR